MRRFHFSSLAICILSLIIAVTLVMFQKLSRPPQGHDKTMQFSLHNLEKSTAYTAPVEFVSESIDIVISEGSFAVTGSYTLRWNDRGLSSFPLIYPFPVDCGLSFPDTVSVTGAGSGEPIPFRENRERGVIAFSVRPGMSDTFSVIYTQKYVGNSVRYILISTKAWGKALERAAFSVTVPQCFLDVELSYEADSISKDGDSVIYSMIKTDFMPDRDLLVTWNNDIRSSQ